ncbi:MAG: hypothetical protein FWG30_06710 [Eubacteriaceae bacterium]|nr:hypothetical protein [Eubacteriaceae bacterium]
MVCANCGAQVKARSASCPVCGAAVARSNRVATILTSLIIIISVASSVIYQYSPYFGNSESQILSKALKSLGQRDSDSFTKLFNSDLEAVNSGLGLPDAQTQYSDMLYFLKEIYSAEYKFVDASMVSEKAINSESNLALPMLNPNIQILKVHDIEIEVQDMQQVQDRIKATIILVCIDNKWYLNSMAIH